MPVTLLRPLCSVSAVRGELGNDQASIEDKIKEAINNASRYLERVTGRVWGFVDHSGANPALVLRKASPVKAIMGNELFVPVSPIITLTQLVEDGVVLTEHTHFEKDDGLGVIVRVGREWGETVGLIGTFGYAAADAETVPTGLPGDLSVAAQKIAAAWSGEMRRESVGFDGKKVSLSDKEIPKTAYKLLKPFIASNT